MTAVRLSFASSCRFRFKPERRSRDNGYKTQEERITVRWLPCCVHAHDRVRGNA